MHQTESRALRRAVVVLVVLSAGRWAWSARTPHTAASGEDVLPELLATSREASSDEARRATPLAEGERVDPNRAGEVELDRLPGVGPATARAIVTARERGLVFRTPEDLLEVRGIGPATLARIAPLLDLATTPPVLRATARGGLASGAPTLVDVNRAGVEALQALPGVGPHLAELIVAAREEQMFTSLDDLVRVRGIGEATVERLRPHATVGPRR